MTLTCPHCRDPNDKRTFPDDSKLKNHVRNYHQDFTVSYVDMNAYVFVHRPNHGASDMGCTQLIIGANNFGRQGAWDSWDAEKLFVPGPSPGSS
ncbi:hypothetical protein VTP01DRAFT_980 [Rhizomucor pusillus]|uniref:uncharacterized protein n=1 Tax=Rhizomucor pusillus TaxID=4840 RepID=UPI003744222E